MVMEPWFEPVLDATESIVAMVRVEVEVDGKLLLKVVSKRTSRM